MSLSNEQTYAGSPQEEVDVEEIAKKFNPESRLRRYTGPMKMAITIFAIVWSLFQIYYSSFGVLDAMIFRGSFLGFLLVMIFLLVPARKKDEKIRSLPTWWDLLCIAGSVLSVAYLILNYNAYVLERGGLHVPLDYLFGAIGILVTFEAARRSAGIILTLLSAVFLIYCFVGVYIPGIFGHAGLSMNRVIDTMWWSSLGIFGTVIGVASTYVFLFVLFGVFLRVSGFTDFINNISMAITGRFSGGIAKVAIFGSGMMGMINGSGVANATTVGTVTIPLMKKSGYQPHFAAGIEAVAGTGGVIAPPIMGAAAFIMAEFTGIPYTTVMIAAIIPAVLYYLTLFMSVHFEAKRLGLKGLPKEELPKVWDVLKKDGMLIIPVIVLVAMMFMGFTPLFAAVFSMICTVVVSWVRPGNRMGIRKILQALEEGAKSVLTVGAACTIIGVVVGTIMLTSVGLTIGNNIMALAGENLFLIALFTAIICIILGMGVPVSASYIIVATIAAPLLVQMGTPVLVAHFFAFYFAALSDITPPVALAALAAAGIAGSSPMKTAVTACQLGIVGFLVPFFFLYNPALLFGEAAIGSSVWAGTFACIASVCLAAGFANRFFHKANVVQRASFFIAAILMLIPDVMFNLVGVGLTAVIVIWQWLTHSKHPDSVSEVSQIS